MGMQRSEFIRVGWMMTSLLVIVVIGYGLFGKRLPDFEASNGAESTYNASEAQEDSLAGQSLLKPFKKTIPIAATPWHPELYAPSLEGTDIDGSLAMDAHGRLIKSIKLKDFFDYFLSAVGEVPLESAIAEIASHARQRLSPMAEQEALEVLDDYLEYQRQMASLLQQPLTAYEHQDYQYYSEQLRTAFDAIRALRNSIFDLEVREAFFGFEEAYSEYAVALVEINASDGLSQEQKIQLKNELEQQLPEHLKDSMENNRQRLELANEAESEFKNGVDREQIKVKLSTEFNDDEVTRFVTQLAKEQEWRQRWIEYQSKKEIIEESSLSQEDQSQQIESLKYSLFDENETTKLLSVEAMAERDVFQP